MKFLLLWNHPLPLWKGNFVLMLYYMLCCGVKAHTEISVSNNIENPQIAINEI